MRLPSLLRCAHACSRIVCCYRSNLARYTGMCFGEEADALAAGHDLHEAYAHHRFKKFGSGFAAPSAHSAAVN